MNNFETYNLQMDNTFKFDKFTLPDNDHTKEHKTWQNDFQFQHALWMSHQSVPPNHLLVQEL